MKKAILISFICGIAMMFSSFAMALDAPKWNEGPDAPCDLPTFVDSEVDGPSLCFDWVEVEKALKYSVDIVIDEDVEGTDETIAREFSFGTSDRTDGESMDEPFLCVPLTDLQYDGESIYGKVTVKVKALAPGKGKGPQNHPFSTSRELCFLELTEPI